MLPTIIYMDSYLHIKESPSPSMQKKNTAIIALRNHIQKNKTQSAAIISPPKTPIMSKRAPIAAASPDCMRFASSCHLHNSGEPRNFSKPGRTTKQLKKFLDK
jgi:hypothetical protein